MMKNPNEPKDIPVSLGTLATPIVFDAETIRQLQAFAKRLKDLQDFDDAWKLQQPDNAR